MSALSSSDFISIWEGGLDLHPLDQCLLALKVGLPEVLHDALADWPLGKRNKALLELRYRCFGPSLPCWTSCPRCAEKLEFTLDARTLMSPAQPDSSDQIAVNSRSFRLPTSRDLAQVATETDTRVAVLRLLNMCYVDDGDSPSWSEEDLLQAGERFAAADPNAETLLQLHCAACGEEWNESLDLGSFLWTEIEAQAKRVLAQIHEIASAYGWTEKEILSLSDSRRALYLDLVQR